MSQQIVFLLIQQGGGPGIGYYLPLMLMMFAVFYFFMIVPQRKQARALEDMRNNLKPGDKVVTSGGLYGQVISVREDKRSVQLKIAENVRVEVARTAISGLQETPEQKS